MGKLGQHTKGKDKQADDQDNEHDPENLAITSTNQGWIRLIAFDCDVVQVSQVIEQGLH